MRYLVCCIVFITALASPVQANDAMVGQIVRYTNDVISLLDRHVSAPRRSLNPLTSTQGNIDNEITAVLDNILVILGGGSIIEAKNRINRLKEENGKSEKRIANLTFQRMEAPLERRWHEVRTATRSEIDQRLSNEREAIENRLNTIEMLENDIRNELRNLESFRNASNEQIDRLFLSVMGEYDLQFYVAMNNIFNIIEILQSLLKDSGENIHIAKTYFGTYYIMIKAFARQHDIVLSRIDTVYIPELNSIINDNKNAMQESRRLMRQDASHERIYKSQQITEKTAQLYLRLLQQQRQQVVKNRVGVMKTLVLAENTYKTVNIAHRLGQVMQASQDELTQLLSLEVPALMGFDNVEMAQEFARLTERLQAAARN